MKITTEWQGKMRFAATDGERVGSMDALAPIGEGTALSPKQWLLASICGCTGIDVAARMRKLRQNLKSLRIEADAPKREGKPATFDSVTLDYFLEGEISEEAALAAVVSSQTEDCGISAMVAAHCPIHYRVHLNGRLLKDGQANFSASLKIQNHS